MSIYNDHVAYAKKVRIPVRLAEIWCKRQKELGEEIIKAKKCPKCGKETLEYEIGSYEEGYNDYVYCSNDRIPAIDEDGDEYLTECDFISDPTEELAPLQPWYDFDVIMAFSGGTVDRNQEFGNLQEWLKFVRDEVSKITLKASA